MFLDLPALKAKKKKNLFPYSLFIKKVIFVTQNRDLLHSFITAHFTLIFVLNRKEPQRWLQERLRNTGEAGRTQGQTGEPKQPE